jgi:hypothetical protein
LLEGIVPAEYVKMTQKLPKREKLEKLYSQVNQKIYRKEKQLEDLKKKQESKLHQFVSFALNLGSSKGLAKEQLKIDQLADEIIEKYAIRSQAKRNIKSLFLLEESLRRYTKVGEKIFALSDLGKTRLSQLADEFFNQVFEWEYEDFNALLERQAEENIDRGI